MQEESLPLEQLGMPGCATKALHRLLPMAIQHVYNSSSSIIVHYDMNSIIQ